MKKILLLLSVLFSGIAFSQTFSLISISYPTCYGSCDGVAVYTPTTAVPGPFTAVLSNTASCVNTTVQSSSGNTITISGLCVCAGTYSINFYNSSNILVGYELLQVPITATSALVLQTPTVDPAVCSTCCNGSVTVSFSGGYAPPPNNATVTLDGVDVIGSYSPIDSVCVGQHTVCVKDMANCIVCNTFSVNFVTHVGLEEYSSGNSSLLLPNPAQDKLLIRAAKGEMLSEIKLVDMSGKVVLQLNTDLKSEQEINISNIPVGVYTVEIMGNRNFSRQKLIKLQ
jgi:hypothetical protein